LRRSIERKQKKKSYEVGLGDVIREKKKADAVTSEKSSRGAQCTPKFVRKVKKKTTPEEDPL